MKADKRAAQAAIFTRAHGMARAMVKNNPGQPYRALFGAALVMIHAEHAEKEQAEKTVKIEFIGPVQMVSSFAPVSVIVGGDVQMQWPTANWQESASNTASNSASNTASWLDPETLIPFVFGAAFLGILFFVLIPTMAIVYK